MRPGYYIDGCVPDQILLFPVSSYHFTVVIGSKRSETLSRKAGYQASCTSESNRATKSIYIAPSDTNFTCTTFEEVQQQYPEFFI